MAEKRYKPPFCIYVVWHPRFLKGGEIADRIYAWFSRDTTTPLVRGIGIPVFYRTIPENNKAVPKAIPLNGADYNAIVILIDDYLFNDDGWNKFVKNLVAKRKANPNTRLFPISLSSNAKFFEEDTLGREQFIDIPDMNSPEETAKGLKIIKHRLLHSFCRLLLDKGPVLKKGKEKIPPPVKLFISHAKKDGRTEAEAFRNHIESSTKLNTFFDANDIADGYRFDTQLKDAIKDEKAALVVFHSDAYSEREWCQAEVLTAKRYKLPIVIVHNMNIGEFRSFPYLGNAPTIKFTGDNFDDIIDLSLYQILFNIFHMENLKRIRQRFAPRSVECIELTSPPELFNFIDILKKKRQSGKKKIIVLYPDPPLGANEMSVLNELDNEISFVTPVQLSTMI